MAKCNQLTFLPFKRLIFIPQNNICSYSSTVLQVIFILYLILIHKHVIVVYMEHLFYTKHYVYWLVTLSINNKNDF